MKKIWIVAVSCIMCAGCNKNTDALPKDYGEAVFSHSFVQVFYEVKAINIYRVDGKSFKVIMRGSSFMLEDGEIYEQYCEKYEDTFFNRYIDYPSTAVINDFQGINVYLDGVCVNENVRMEFMSPRLFVESGYTKPENAMVNETLVSPSALECIKEIVADITEEDLRMMDNEFVLTFSTSVDNGCQLSVEMLSDGETILGLLP